MRLACYCLKVTGRCPMWSRRRQSVDGRQIRFGDEIELVGAQAPQGRFVAGDIIDVTLIGVPSRPLRRITHFSFNCWRPITPSLATSPPTPAGGASPPACGKQTGSTSTAIAWRGR
ncbi:MAG: hypothetical protein R2856_33880 [Caldilineaceae bacterium]